MNVYNVNLGTSLMFRTIQRMVPFFFNKIDILKKQTPVTQVFFKSKYISNPIACSFKPGQTVLDVAFENDIDIEGACGGKCNCSTCHVILEEDAMEKFPQPDDDELDLLDVVPCLEKTSRLGCQLTLKEEHDGITLTLPDEVINQCYT